MRKGGAGSAKKTDTVTKAGKALLLLKAACGIGFILVPLFLTALIFFTLSTAESPFRAKKAASGDKWYAALDEFDSLYTRYSAHSALVNPAMFKSILDKAEENSVGAESRLSLLKRRRLLAKTPAAGNYFINDYYVSAKRAAADFPHSAPVAALTAEALVLRLRASEGRSAAAAAWGGGYGGGGYGGEGGGGYSGGGYSGGGYSGAAADGGYSGGGRVSAAYPDEDAAFIKERTRVMLDTGPLSEAVYMPLAFSFLTLSGALTTLEAALSQPRGPALFAAAAGGNESLLVDTALLHILNGGSGEALPFITPLHTEGASKTNTRSFLANYHYDFGDMLTAGELFYSLNDAENIEMAADALYLAGERQGAFNFWHLLSRGNKNTLGGVYLRALYNTASLGQAAAAENGRRGKQENGEYIAALEQIFLLTANTDDSLEPVRIPAFALYTRFLPAARARALLESDERVKKEALLDLELLKRNVSSFDIPKGAAETWLLLNRHPDSPDIYQWAAWYFEYQKLYEDAGFLSHFAAQNGVESPALLFNKSLQMLRGGDLSSAGEILTELAGSLPSSSSGLARPADGIWSILWPADANLALLLETGRSYRPALLHYEKALGALLLHSSSAPLNARPETVPLSARKKAALLLARISRCCAVLGQRIEAREALERALQFDGDNINLNLALRNL